MQSRFAWFTTSSIGAVAVVLVSAGGFGPAHAQTWSSMFPGDGHLDGVANALMVHGDELYVAGLFAHCMSSRTVNYVARWNGQRWAGVGEGLWIDNYHASYAYALVPFDDPNLPQGDLLYAGTTDGVFREPNDPSDPNEPWAWIAATDAPVRALAVFEGNLYAAGEFTDIAGEDANYIARWNGTSWEEVGGGVGPDPNDANSPPAKVLALTVFDDGGGEALFAGGTFLTAGAVSAKRVARSRDGTWSALGAGIQGATSTEVDALAAWDATGRLYVGGNLSFPLDPNDPNGPTVRGIAAAHCDPNDTWTWGTLGEGVSTATGASGTVRCLAVLAVDEAEVLYVGGRFDFVDGSILAGKIALWDGDFWSFLGTYGAEGFDLSPLALAAYDDGAGSKLYAAGNFHRADGFAANGIARLEGDHWSPLGRAPDFTPYAFCAVYEWDKPRLYVAGGFHQIGDLWTGALACWDRSAWSAIDGAPNDRVQALATFDDGSGLDLFVGGGTVDVDHADGGGDLMGFIARGRMVYHTEVQPHYWGWSWSRATVYGNDGVCAFAEFQDANDPQPILYAAGEFTEIDGRPAHYIARWNPDPNDPRWEEVGDPNDPNHPQGNLYALAVYDPNDGPPALYAAGDDFLKWQGGSWTNFGGGATYALAVFDEPNEAGASLYLGRVGALSRSSGGAYSNVLAFDGSIHALQVHDDGGGPALYFGGWHPDPNDPPQPHFLLKWDGTEVSYVAEGPADHVMSLGVFHDDPLSGYDALWAGGHFLTAGNSAWADTDSQFIARWGIDVQIDP